MKPLIIFSTLLLLLHATPTFYDIPKILWTFWDTGFDSARLFTRMCINNMAHYSNISGWEFRFLSNKNYTQYISAESLQRLNDMYEHSEHKIGRQNWADLMRLFLIYQNGGMWVDTNSFFLGNFSWIEKIAAEPWLTNRLSPQPEIITFSLSSVMGGNKTVVYDEKLGQDVYLFPGVEIWAFISKPKSKFLTDVINRLEYSLKVKREVLDAETQNEKIVFGREKDPYYITSNYVFQTVMQKKQHELQTTSNSTVKYAVQYYKMWNMPAQNTIYGVFSAYNWFTFSVIGVLLSESLQSIVQRHHVPAYFIKFNGGNYPHINNALIHHEFAGCLGVDVTIKEGSLFKEYMMKQSSELSEIKHINELYELGYMNGDCKHFGSVVTSYIANIKAIVIGFILLLILANLLVLKIIKWRTTSKSL